MKKTFLSLVLAVSFLTVFSQKTITNKYNDITITSQGFNYSQSDVMYTITIGLGAVDSAVTIFPFIQGNLFFKGINFYYIAYTHVSEMQYLMENAEVEQSDIGIKGNILMGNFGLTMIWETNSLGLNKNNWNYNENN